MVAHVLLQCLIHGLFASTGLTLKGKPPIAGKKISPHPNLNPKLNGGSHSPLIEGSIFPWRDNRIQYAQVISAPRVALGHPRSSSAFPNLVSFRAQLCRARLPGELCWDGVWLLELLWCRWEGLHWLTFAPIFPAREKAPVGYSLF